MLRNILYEITLFAKGDDPDESRIDLGWFLEALVQRNQGYLRERPNTPKLYKSGVVYERPAQSLGECEEVRVLKEAIGPFRSRLPKVRKVLDQVQAVFGGERFRDIGVLLERGSGDCDNVACWRVAELRQGGIRARPYLKWRTNDNGGTTYHALVIWPDGSSEDPSLLLGMGGADRAADRRKEIENNIERCAPEYLAEARVIRGGMPLPALSGDGGGGGEDGENGVEDQDGDLQRAVVELERLAA